MFFYRHPVILMYVRVVPRLWNETIDAHRRAVREAILDTTAALVARHGLRSVTMSQIAEDAGIGRATLYKYFPDVETILAVWHERQVASHVQELIKIRDQAGDARSRLEAVLQSYAFRSSRDHDSNIATRLHQGEHVARAHQQLCSILSDLLTEGAENGDIRADVAPEELAVFCIHALAAASAMPSKAAVRRLVAVTMAGLKPPG